MGSMSSMLKMRIKKEDAAYEQDVMTNRFLLSGWRIKDELGINSESWDWDEHDEGEYKKRDAAYEQYMMTLGFLPGGWRISSEVVTNDKVENKNKYTMLDEYIP